MYKKTKGYAQGGKMKSKGMKNGGVTSKGYKIGGKVAGGQMSTKGFRMGGVIAMNTKGNKKGGKKGGKP